jgi:predicted O-methyltransferase YrrM
MNSQIKAAIDKMQVFMRDKTDAYTLPIESARFVHAMVLSTRSRRCVEVGTSYGHSGLWIGAAAQANGGDLITIDIEQRKVDIAAGFFAEAGLASVITCRVAPALEVLEQIKGPIDFALLDADKENLRAYTELIHSKMSPHGLILTDNATSNEMVSDEFCPWIRQDKRFFSTLATVGKGIEVSVKIA